MTTKKELIEKAKADWRKADADRDKAVADWDKADALPDDEVGK